MLAGNFQKTIRLAARLLDTLEYTRSSLNNTPDTNVRFAVFPYEMPTFGRSWHKLKVLPHSWVSPS